MEDGISASEYFSNLQGYVDTFITFVPGDTPQASGGEVRLVLNKDADSVPEPATATLSLLELAALVARRRRK